MIHKPVRIQDIFALTIESQTTWRIYDAHGMLLCGGLYKAEAEEIAQALNDGERMRVENERLRKALAPFATVARRFESDIESWHVRYEDEHELTIDHNKSPIHSMLCVGDLRRAADALREGAGDEKKL